MPTITALKAQLPDRVLVDLDGTSWRALPRAVVVECSLRRGVVLDRALARRLRRALRAHEASTAALRSLASRDLTAAQLDAQLRRAGVAPAQRAQTSAALARTGVLDDARLAARRAAALAERGLGDEAIRSDLAARGLAGEVVEAAVGELEPERERAGRIVEQRGVGVRTARYLAARGFGEDAVERAAPDVIAD